MTNLNQLYAVVENGIESLGIPASSVRALNEGEWNFNRGSADIAVGILISDRFPNGYFYVNCILMDSRLVPSEKKEEFYRHLLQITSSLVNMKLCIDENGLVSLVTNRDASGLDPVEVAHSINSLSYYADLLDDQLKETFTQNY